MAGAEVVGAALEEVVALVLAVELSPDFPSLLQAVRVPATAVTACVWPHGLVGVPVCGLLRASGDHQQR